MLKFYHVNPETDWIGGTRLAAKVAIALRELGLPHETVLVDRKKDMRNPDSFFRKSLNKLGTVPVIDHDGFILREANAILRYLGGLTDNTLWPSDSRKRAIVDQWMCWEQTTLTPSLMDVYRLATFDSENAESPAKSQAQYVEKLKKPGMRGAQENWNKSLSVLDAELGHHDYVTGTYSLADIALGCVIPIGPVLGVDLTPHRHINVWLRRLELKSSWKVEKTFTLDIDCGKLAGLIACTEEERRAIKPRLWANP